MPAWTGAGAEATAPPKRSCWMPCFSCIHFSIAIPIASGTESTLFGPSPPTRSDEMPRSWRYTSRSGMRSEEHTSELQSHSDLVCRLLLEKKKKTKKKHKEI